jgi:hypothetical protein
MNASSMSLEQRERGIHAICRGRDDDREHPGRSLIEVNVVDPFVRKGYRFKGPAVIHEPGSAVFAEGVERMRADGSSQFRKTITAGA